MTHKDFILTLSCPDRKGIVHDVTGTLLAHDGNIVDAQQFGDEQTGRFFLRVHFRTAENQDRKALEHDFTQLGQKFQMHWQLHDAAKPARLLIMVSRQGHCLNDLLFRISSGQLNAKAVAIVSNHRDFENLAHAYDIPFHYLPVTPETKATQEEALLSLVQSLDIDLVVLARYMQILSAPLCEALQGRAINIHHSFLPSFKGARPYYQAHARGVKLIGATAHYVTADLDEGPIIEQDIERVDHAMSAQDLTQVGSDIESLVLSRAVRAHIEHRVLLNDSRTVVFR
ncbi:formyltetrahydrofolate deformylase [Orrella sp. 11846]|uniref:formyltetrahydrofolate deformylase n=1 Tax=Orrella sp. 11846 TaxID=3409913 RepID=UPI003B5A2CFA